MWRKYHETRRQFDNTIWKNEAGWVPHSNSKLSKISHMKKKNYTDLKKDKNEYAYIRKEEQNKIINSSMISNWHSNKEMKIFGPEASQIS